MIDLYVSSKSQLKARIRQTPKTFERVFFLSFSADEFKVCFSPQILVGYRCSYIQTNFSH